MEVMRDIKVTLKIEIHIADSIIVNPRLVFSFKFLVFRACTQQFVTDSAEN